MSQEDLPQDHERTVVRAILHVHDARHAVTGEGVPNHVDAGGHSDLLDGTVVGQVCPHLNAGALIKRIGLWGPLYYYNKEHPTWYR